MRRARVRFVVACVSAASAALGACSLRSLGYLDEAYGDAASEEGNDDAIDATPPPPDHTTSDAPSADSPVPDGPYDAAADALAEADAVADAACADANFSNDPHNCGRCGHDCVGGACAAGACQAVVIESNISEVQGLAANATGAYWARANAFEIGKLAPDGSVVHYAQAFSPWAMAVDETNLYWTSWATGLVFVCSNSVQPCNNAVPIAGKPGAYENLPNAVTADDASVYWLDFGTLDGGYYDGVMKSCATAGCAQAPATVASPIQRAVQHQIAVDDTYVYFAAVPPAPPRLLLRSPKQPAPDGGAVTPTALVEAGSVDGIAMGKGVLYWTLRAPKNNGGAVYALALDGGSIVQLALDDYPSPIAFDGTAIYWATDTAIETCAPSNCTATRATLATTTYALPQLVAVDAVSVFFTTLDDGGPNGSVRRIAKP